MRMLLLFFVFLLMVSAAIAQPKIVTKTYAKPVLIHYMPWFDTPEFSGFWGWHWKMNTMDPDSILPSGKRQIASHYYPLIGPYASIDPNVVEYHLLLMKYSGIDGVLIDWYGEKGSNGDILQLLQNSNAVIDQVEKMGLQYAVVLEDRFADTITDAQANLAYLKNNYFNDSAYFRYGTGNHPLMGVFGPITFETEAEWDSILPFGGEEIEFLTLWYEKSDAGMNADGEYAWIYEIDSLNDFADRLRNFHKFRAPTLKTAMSVAYPGFEDFYLEGGAGPGFFEIPHENGKTLDTTLSIALEHDSVVDILQLATWNDFGEGTNFEPTCEFRFTFLNILQNKLGVTYDTTHLSQIHRLYLLRKSYAADSAAQVVLDDVAAYFACLEDSDAVHLMDSLEGLLVNLEGTGIHSSNLTAFPNPFESELHLELSVEREGEFQIELMTLEGKIVYRELHRMTTGKSKITLSVRGIYAGVYFLRVKNGARVLATRKVVRH